MDKFVIQGGRKLNGAVTISGAKNATLALMPAALLARGTFRLRNTPVLRDVATIASLLKTMGMRIDFKDHTLTLDTANVNKQEAPYEHVKKMRASIYVLGPLLARYGRAKVSLPGGCAWGPRPVNLHIEGIRKLGAKVEIEQGYIIARATQLHTIAMGNLVPSYRVIGNNRVRPVFFYTVDMSEFAANKLANRGSLTAHSILTNVQDFVVTVKLGLRRRDRGARR